MPNRNETDAATQALEDLELLGPDPTDWASHLNGQCCHFTCEAADALARMPHLLVELASRVQAIPAPPPDGQVKDVNLVRDEILEVLHAANLPGEGISFVLAYQTEALHTAPDASFHDSNIYGWVSHGSLASSLGMTMLVQQDISANLQNNRR